jgi:hypothetical protein
VILFLFEGGPAPECSGTSDFNLDGQLNVTDPISMLNTLFLGAPVPGGNEPAQVSCR